MDDIMATITALRETYKARGVEEIPAVRCPICGAEIGYYQEIGERRVALRVGNLVLTRADGNCAECGQEWHYSASEKQLERLIARVKHG